MQMRCVVATWTGGGATRGLIFPLPKQSHPCSQPQRLKTSCFSFPQDPLLSPQLPPSVSQASDI